MHDRATNRAYVLDALRAVRPLLDGRARDHVERALAAADAEPGRLAAGELDELSDEAYFSADRDVALFQAALDGAETLPAPGTWASPDTEDTLRSVAEYLDKYLFMPRRRFPWPERAADFRHGMANETTVALLSDWGTGRNEARIVLRHALRDDPDHLIHLGDIYPMGTPSRARERFLDLFDNKPSVKTLWALNGNHEMFAKGTGYQDVVLPACERQEGASVFALENDHWRLIGLDTAYDDHDLNDEQIEVVRAGGLIAWSRQST